MHEQEVARILLLTYALGYTRGHGNCRNARRTYKRINLSARKFVHKLAEQNAERGAHRERDKSEKDDPESLKIQESRGNCGGADAYSEEQRDDIHQCVLSCVAETFRNTGLLEEVSEHKASDKRSSRREKEDDE